MNTFDYVIAGGGTAASIIAFRLAEKGHRVCVLEAGPADRNPYVRIPAGFIKTLFDPQLTWQYSYEPSSATNNRAIQVTQGKTLGGSSSVNGMVYNRGQAADFDHWASLGNPGWAYEDILPCFRRSETRIGPGDDRYRGRSGPLKVTTRPWPSELVSAFVRAAEQEGQRTGPESGIGACLGKTEAALATSDYSLVSTPGSYEQGFIGRLDDFPGMTCGVWVMRPKSAGYVRIAGADPRLAPIANPNYLVDEDDCQRLVKALKAAELILASGT